MRFVNFKCVWGGGLFVYLERTSELQQCNIMRRFMFFKKILAGKPLLTVGAFVYTLPRVFQQMRQQLTLYIWDILRPIFIPKLEDFYFVCKSINTWEARGFEVKAQAWKLQYNPSFFLSIICASLSYSYLQFINSYFFL